MIDKDHLKKIFKQYLGPFAVMISPGERREYVEVLRKEESLFIQASQRRLRTMGCFILMNWGWKKYKSLYSYEVVDLFLGTGKENETETFYDVSVPLLIIYHMSGTMENRQLENLINHTISQRNLQNLTTVVLTEAPLGKVESLMRSLMIKVIKPASGQDQPGSEPIL